MTRRWTFLAPVREGKVLPEHTQFEVRIGGESVYLRFRYECRGRGTPPNVELVVLHEFDPTFGAEALLFRRDLTRLRSFLGMLTAHTTVRLRAFSEKDSREAEAIVMLRRGLGGTEVWCEHPSQRTRGQVLTLTPGEEIALVGVVDAALANERSL